MACAAKRFLSASRVYLSAISASVQPKIAMSSFTVAPASANRRAAALRMPCAERSLSPAFLQAATNSSPRRYRLADLGARRCGDESELALAPVRAGRERLLQLGAGRKVDHDASLLGPNLERAVLLDVLAAEPLRVADP